MTDEVKPEMTPKERRQMNLAKARAVRAANRVTERKDGRVEVKAEAKPEGDAAVIRRELEMRGRTRTNHLRKDDADEVDPKYIPPELIPEGWTFQWKNVTVLGQPIEELVPGYRATMEMNHWEPVPAALLRSILPRSYTGRTVEMGGQMLMMQQTYLAEQSKSRNEKNANDLMQSSAKKLGVAGTGELDRKVQTVRRTYEKMAVPDAL